MPLDASDSFLWSSCLGMYGNSPFTAPASLRALKGGSAGRLHSLTLHSLLVVSLTSHCLWPVELELCCQVV